MGTSQNSTTDILSKVIKSIFYRTALGKAPKIARNASSLFKLLQNTLAKTQKMGVGGVFDSVREKVVILGTLIKAYATGEYRQISLPSLFKIIAGLVYFISPIDFIPDFLPVVGLTDDVALLLYIINTIDDELISFEQWQKNKPIKV